MALRDGLVLAYEDGQAPSRLSITIEDLRVVVVFPPGRSKRAWRRSVLAVSMFIAVLFMLTSAVARLLSPVLSALASAVRPAQQIVRFYMGVAAFPVWVAVAGGLAVAWEQYKNYRRFRWPKVFSADDVEVSMTTMSWWGPNRRVWPAHRVTGVDLSPLDGWLARPARHPFTPHVNGYLVVIRFDGLIPVKLHFWANDKTAADEVHRGLGRLLTSRG